MLCTTRFSQAGHSSDPMGGVSVANLKGFGRLNIQLITIFSITKNDQKNQKGRDRGKVWNQIRWSPEKDYEKIRAPTACKVRLSSLRKGT